MIRNHNGFQANEAFETLETALKDRADEFAIERGDYNYTVGVMRKSDKKAFYVAIAYRHGEAESFCLEPHEIIDRLKKYGWI